MASTLGFLITVACVSTGFGLLNEPPPCTCPRIGFEETMWQKMVMLEHTVKSTFSSINASLEEVSTEKRKQMRNIETFKTDQKESFGAFKIATHDVINQHAMQQEKAIKEMSSKYDTMVAQTDRKIKQVQADIKEQRPVLAFSVGLTRTTTVNENGRVYYDKIFMNLMQGYRRETGVFRAPVAGVYEFSYHVLAEKDKSIWLELVHNSRYINSLYCKTLKGFAAAGNSVIIDIDAGDVVYVRSHETSTLYGRTDQIYCTFSGRLLHAQG